ncbi:MAG: permease [Jiangellales bacterium]
MSLLTRPPAPAGAARVWLGLLGAGSAWVLLYALNERLWPVLLGDVLGLDTTSRAGESLAFFFYDTVKIMLLLVGLIFVVGMLRTTLSPERVRDVLAGRGLMAGLVLAALLGAVTPFCSCSSIPLFIGFVAAGVPLSITLSFLIASPLINEVAVVMLGGTFGWGVTAIYVGAGLALAIAAGWTFSRFDLDRWVEPFVFSTPVAALSAEGGSPTMAARVDAARAETRDIVAKVWPYVLVGVGIGALIHGWVPADFFARYAGSDNPLSVLVATLAGIPLYANAAGVIPLAEALWAKGVALGTVMAFMMSVVALSIPSLVMLRRVLRTPLLVLFTALITVGIIAVGLLLNLVT